MKKIENNNFSLKWLNNGILLPLISMALISTFILIIFLFLTN